MEVFVVNDGPATAELETLLTFLSSDAECPVTLLALPEKTGYYAVSSNYGIVHAHAPYVAFLDADNEWTSSHLSGLLKAIRTPHPKSWLPGFVYSRRRYVRDDTCTKSGVPADVDSPLVPWEPARIVAMMQDPMNNFVDSSDGLIGTSVLYKLFETTGCFFNPNCLRFGDWEILTRLARMGVRGRAVDQVTHVYHWTGGNVQLTRKPEDLVGIPRDVYDRFSDFESGTGRDSDE